jgi:DNA-binding CsgD family transcriptional regulator
MNPEDPGPGSAAVAAGSEGPCVVVCGACGASLDASSSPGAPTEPLFRTALRTGQVLATTGGHSPVGVELDGLTPREQEIVSMLLQGYRVKTITRLLGIASSTVNNHLRTVRMKYGVASQAELIEVLRGRGPTGEHV